MTARRNNSAVIFWTRANNRVAGLGQQLSRWLFEVPLSLYLVASTASLRSYALSHTFWTDMTPDWKELVAEKKSRQQASIPKDWILTNLPSKLVLDITKFPEECALLSTKDVEITNTSVDILLENLATGSWSAVAVTTAFCKRAIIAHQLVRVIHLVRVKIAHRLLNSSGQLPH